MRLQAGTIYFARETNLDQPGYSNLVKIGLVEDPRTDWDRLSEHQTGNPRKLELLEGQSVHTQAVKYVESQMHKAFASKRIQGEWFRFDSEAEIEVAVDKAKSLAAEVEDRVPVFSAALKLEKVFHKGEVKQANQELRDLVKQILTNQVILGKYNSMISKIKSSMKRAAAEHEEGAALYAETITVYHKPKFSVGQFRKMFGKTHADLIATCTNKESVPFEDFSLLSDGVEVSIPDDLQERLDDLESKVNRLTSAKDYYELNNLLLQIREESSVFEWEVEFNLAKIKVACGEAPGIEGVCSWIRELRLSKAKFDAGKLAHLEPELYKQAIVQTEPSPRTIYRWYKTDKTP